MKIALSILLGVSVLLNLLLVGCQFYKPENRTFEYKGQVLSKEQMDILMYREKESHPEICDIIEQYHVFIRNVQGKQLIILEEK